MRDFEPKVVVFCCNWGACGSADPNPVSSKVNSKIIRTMCSGKIEPTYVIQAFAKGVDGVMIAGCKHGDCHYQSGNYKARRRLMLLKNTLSQLGIEPDRLRIEWISANEAPNFQPILDGFIDKVTQLGPLTSK